jgi:RHS repeat-associated protein
VTLYGKGEAVSISVNGGSGVYLGKDVMGSVRSVSNGYGSIEERYEYDAFGEPYRGDLTGGMNLAYTGKPYDTATGLYNYGYRDYSPALARFTTADPVRDGTNWFAYVNNDPVNWIDPWGLSASDKRTSTAYMIPLLGAGATIVVGANVTLSYVFDTAGNKGIAISGDIGVGVSASVDLPVSTVVNMLLQEISTLSGTTSIPGKIQNFAGPYAVTNVHLGLGLTQDINNPKDTRITFDTAIGGGSYIGYTYVIEFFDGDGEK